MTIAVDLVRKATKQTNKMTKAQAEPVTYIRVTGNFNEISLLNKSSFEGHLTQVN